MVATSLYSTKKDEEATEPPQKTRAPPVEDEDQVVRMAERTCERELNVLRRWRLLHGGAQDLAGQAVLVARPDFDLNRTIFRSVSSPIARAGIAARLRLEPFWRDDVIAEVSYSASTPQRAPRHDTALLRFMTEECDFAMEHADGSFMEHLQFCYEYASKHFSRGPSPRVLLLHSILGVGTNYFPCTSEKIPALKALLTADEMTHVEAFPAVLRLILSRRLLDALDAVDARDASRDDFGLRAHKVIDNAPFALNRDDLFVHLNYQLIHLLDFLPAADWGRAARADAFLASFARLHRTLRRLGKLQAHIDFDLAGYASGDGGAVTTQPSSTNNNNKLAPVTLGALVLDYVPGPIQLAIAARQVTRFSADIGHSLDFDLLCPSQRS